MKKFFTIPTLILATLALSLSSCLSENIYDDNSRRPVEETDGYRTISLRIEDAATAAATRGITRPIPDGEQVRFNDGIIYMVNSAGVIVRHFVVVDDDDYSILPAEAILTDGANIYRGDLTRAAGVNIESVPGSIVEVVMIGNYQGTGVDALPTSGNANTISNRLLNVTSQHDAWNVNMFGRSGLVRRTDAPAGYPYLTGTGLYSGTTDNPLYAALVHLSPTVARIELPSITGAGMISQFTVEGVFIDNYYRYARINDAIPATTLATDVPPSVVNRRFHDGNAAAFTLNAPNTSYTTAAHGALFDWRASVDTPYRNWTAGLAAPHNEHGLTVFPSGEIDDVPHPGGTYHEMRRVWNYQVFARDYHRTNFPAGFPPGMKPDKLDASTRVPHIVIRLSNIYISDGSYLPDGDVAQTRVDTDGNPRFVTVSSFNRIIRNASGTITGVEPIKGIRASNVYRILGGITFDESDLSLYPGDNPIEVYVEVSLAYWLIDNAVSPGFRQPNPRGTASGVQLAPGSDWPFPLGAATNGDCIEGRSVTYQWQRSTDNVTWVDIEGATAQIFTATNLTETTYFRRIARCQCGGAHIITTAARVVVSI